MEASRWIEVTVTVSPEAVEAVGEKLGEMGAHGFAVTDVGDARALVAYFVAKGATGPKEAEETLAGFVRRLPAWGLDPGPGRVEVRLADEAEWRDAWRRFFHPVKAGRRLVVSPPWDRWAGPEAGSSKIIEIVIDPGQAFGTGQHATTRGALELLEMAVLMGAVPGASQVPSPDFSPGPAILDLGTGSGILAIAAAKLGLEGILAVDNDPVAVAAARVNVAANSVSARRSGPTPAADEKGAPAGEKVPAAGEKVPAADAEVPPAGAVTVAEGDAFELLRTRPRQAARLITANLTTDLVVSAVPGVSKALVPGGLAILAGVSQGEGSARVREAAASAGLEEVAAREAEGWTSFLFRKPLARPRPGSTPPTPAGPGGRPVRRPRPDRLAGPDRAARSDRRPRAVFHTLGCKANLYDTAGMMDALRRAGWVVAARGGENEPAAGSAYAGDSGAAAGGLSPAAARADEVDLYVVNSCAVTARAEAKTRQLARKLKREHPDALVALVGCYPEVARRAALASSGADFALGTSDRERMLDILRERGLGTRGEGQAPETTPTERAIAGPAAPAPGAFAGDRTRATVKVQEGCEQFCSYCVIPYARGPSRSRPAADVLAEVTALVARGFREVVLTGIHLGDWKTGAARLADLVSWVAGLPGLDRLRLSSVEPLEVTDDLIDVMEHRPNVCRHLHIPLQSGSDTVLARMNRRYTAAEYLAIIEKARARLPFLGVTTDVMVGFPGETDEEFAATLETVRRARFSRLHVFRFSPRPGTPAASMPGQVDAGTKRARSDQLIRLGRELGREFRASLIGQVLDVLVEEVTPSAPPVFPSAPRAFPSAAGGSAMASGFTGNYVRVTFTGSDLRHNTIAPVRLEHLTRDGLAGRVAGEGENS